LGNRFPRSFGRWFSDEKKAIVFRFFFSGFVFSAPKFSPVALATRPRAPRTGRADASREKARRAKIAATPPPAKFMT
jgi:hypothetical protein